MTTIRKRFGTAAKGQAMAFATSLLRIEGSAAKIGITVPINAPQVCLSLHRMIDRTEGLDSHSNVIRSYP